MPAYQLDQFLPDIDPSCWIAPCATIIGNVVLGSGSSIWFGSVVRGDNEPIVIGERINIQDGCILHSDPGSPLRIGNDTTVGHRAVVHGCTHRDCIRCRPSAPRCDDRVGHVRLYRNLFRWFCRHRRHRARGELQHSLSGATRALAHLTESAGIHKSAFW